MKYTHTLTLLLVVLAISCNAPAPKEIMNKSLYERVAGLCPGPAKNDLVIYYFDGDCTMCLAKERFIEQKLKNKNSIRPVFIAKTRNPRSVEFTLHSLNIASCVYVEKDNEFEKTLNFLKIVKVDKDRSITNFENILHNY